MSKPRVIPATFHNYRTVLGRKVLQLVFEIPIEQQNEALTLLGYPDAGEPKWYAIARLEQKPAASLPVSEANGSSKPKRKFNELSLPEQCGIRCEDGNFQRFLGDQYGVDHIEEIGTVNVVRNHVGVQSRAELSTNHDAANKWRALEKEYQQWLTDETYKDSTR